MRWVPSPMRWGTTGINPREWICSKGRSLDPGSKTGAAPAVKEALADREVPEAVQVDLGASEEELSRLRLSSGFAGNLSRIN